MNNMIYVSLKFWLEWIVSLYRSMHGSVLYTTLIHQYQQIKYLLKKFIVDVYTLFLFHYMIEIKILLLRKPDVHNITQLLACVLWDHISHEHSSPLFTQFLVYGEHSDYVHVNFSITMSKLSMFFNHNLFLWNQSIT